MGSEHSDCRWQSKASLRQQILRRSAAETVPVRVTAPHRIFPTPFGWQGFLRPCARPRRSGDCSRRSDQVICPFANVRSAGRSFLQQFLSCHPFGRLFPDPPTRQAGGGDFCGRATFPPDSPGTSVHVGGTGRIASVTAGYCYGRENGCFRANGESRVPLQRSGAVPGSRATCVRRFRRSEDQDHPHDKRRNEQDADHRRYQAAEAAAVRRTRSASPAPAAARRSRGSAPRTTGSGTERSTGTMRASRSMRSAGTASEPTGSSRTSAAGSSAESAPSGAASSVHKKHLPKENFYFQYIL